MNNLVVSPVPHLHSGNSLQNIMLDHIIALIPATFFAIYLFKLAALKVVFISVLSAVGWEALLQKLTNRDIVISDLTSVYYGLLFAMLLPPTLPWWIVIIGTFLMVLLGKEVYGGYGANPFNGALISWVILKISFPDFMGKWINPIKGLTTDLTPIEVFKTQGIEYVHHYFSYKNMFLGFRSGFMGQVSVICLLIGGIYLLARKRINWRIPVAYLVGVFLFSFIFWGIGSTSFGDPIFHLLAGGTFISAFFLATDMPSSPVSPQGMLLFGFFCGVLTVVVRLWGSWTFGAYYSVLIVSLITPFLDKILPEPYGR
ncbi:RnfABCDGE type electron transport complex subunit D [Desulfothermus okinawensis JCM 13304]